MRGGFPYLMDYYPKKNESMDKLTDLIDILASCFQNEDMSPEAMAASYHVESELDQLKSIFYYYIDCVR